jgi:hypothetical protein
VAADTDSTVCISTGIAVYLDQESVTRQGQAGLTDRDSATLPDNIHVTTIRKEREALKGWSVSIQ